MLHAQSPPITHQPMDIPASMAGSFGEMRHHHFHSGIDLRSQGKTGQIVRAMADGDLRRIVIKPGGFGWALYLEHPSGHTSVYAHLSEFKQAWMDHAMAYAKRNHRYVIDIPVTKGKFPIKAGDIIGLSGNSGGSGGPHLHVEWRDSQTEEPLNPLTYGLVVNDKVEPAIRGLYAKSTEGAWQLHRPGKDNQLASELIITSWQDLALDVTDHMESGGRPLGIQRITLQVGENMQTLHIQRFAFHQSRGVDALMHMDVQMKKGRRCYRIVPFALKDGQQPADIWEGRGSLPTQGKHHFTLTVEDAHGNRSTLHGDVQLKPLTSARLTHDYRLPGSLQQGSMKVSFPAHSFTHSPSLSLRKGDKQWQWSLSSTAPVLKPFTYTWTVSKEWTEPLDKTLLIVTDFRGNQSRLVGRLLTGGRLHCRSKQWGHMQLSVDTTAPTIRWIQRQGSLATLHLADNRLDIQSMTVTVNGQWVWAYHDAKNRRLLVSDLPESGELVVVAEDEAGNATTFRHSF